MITLEKLELMLVETRARKMRELADLDRTMRVARMMPLGELPECAYMEIVGRYIYIRIDYDRTLMAKVRRLLGRDWILLSKENNSQGNHVREYQWKPDKDTGMGRFDSVRLMLTMDAERIVSGTCHRVLVEEKVSKYQVYQVVCDDGTVGEEPDEEMERVAE